MNNCIALYPSLSFDVYSVLSNISSKQVSCIFLSDPKLFVKLHCNKWHFLTLLVPKIPYWIYTGWHKKTGTFETPNKNWRNPRKKKFIDKNWTFTTCLLRDSNPNYPVWKLRPVDGVLLHVCILSLQLRISKVPVLLCHPLCHTGLLTGQQTCMT